MTTVPASAAHRTVRRRHPFWQLARVEATLFARSAGAVIWTALLPVLAIIVLGAVPGTRHASRSFHGLSVLEVYLPILMIYVFLMSAVTLLPGVLAGYREKGILRRLSTTPVPPARLLGAQSLIYLSLGAVIDVVMLVIAIAFGAPAPRQFGGFVVALVLVALATLGIGAVITALASTERIANAAGLVTFFPLMFFAGLWVPRTKMGTPLRTISDYSPLGAGVRAVQDSLADHWPATAGLLVLAGYAVACGAVAARVFRWQ
jgi:ABC-2 type transport system permease protein